MNAAHRNAALAAQAKRDFDPDYFDPDKASAVPTKNFFVSMLTRDITLIDAVIDFVDNSIDGTMRLAEGSGVDYSKHSVSIDMDGEKFTITDNGGGIPRWGAQKFSLKMGRELDDERDQDIDTIGMHGIGMKRAMFKMGREATIRTLHAGDAYEVPITSEWLDGKSWELPIIDLAAGSFTEAGTTIQVGKLYEFAASRFANVGFLARLREALSEYFTVFLGRGLTILVNGRRIDAAEVGVLVSKGSNGPAPFVFKKEMDGVVVSMAIGLNWNYGLQFDEDEVIDFESPRSAPSAGWTIICNGRAVIFGDKSPLTGWGNGIPLYSYRFSTITGIVEFQSKRAEKLPLATTKRALDITSDIWIQTFNRMLTGIKIWIGYANDMRNFPGSDLRDKWNGAESMPLRLAVDSVATRRGAVLPDGSIEYNPLQEGVVPSPPEKTPCSERIVFSRPVNEVRDISNALFDSAEERPGIVGEACFEIMLEKIQKGEDCEKEHKS